MVSYLNSCKKLDVTLFERLICLIIAALMEVFGCQMSFLLSYFLITHSSAYDRCWWFLL